VGGKRVPGEVVHKVPADLSEALIANSTVCAARKDITPLTRQRRREAGNEPLCVAHTLD
jgi:hypothetical protein